MYTIGMENMWARQKRRWTRRQRLWHIAHFTPPLNIGIINCSGWPLSERHAKLLMAAYSAPVLMLTGQAAVRSSASTSISGLLGSRSLRILCHFNLWFSSHARVDILFWATSVRNLDDFCRLSCGSLSSHLSGITCHSSWLSCSPSKFEARHRHRSCFKGETPFKKRGKAMDLIVRSRPSGCTDWSWLVSIF